MNDKELFTYTVGLLQKLSIKYEVHTFPSGAIMLDIWHKDHFYVLQFEGKFIGFSEINKENIGFDTMPDEKFHNEQKYKIKLTSLFDRE